MPAITIGRARVPSMPNSSRLPSPDTARPPLAGLPALVPLMKLKSPGTAPCLRRLMRLQGGVKAGGRDLMTDETTGPETGSAAAAGFMQPEHADMLAPYAALPGRDPGPCGGRAVAICSRAKISFAGVTGPPGGLPGTVGGGVLPVAAVAGIAVQAGPVPGQVDENGPAVRGEAAAQTPGLAEAICAATRSSTGASSLVTCRCQPPSWSVSHGRASDSSSRSFTMAATARG
jgi:hypothetical protein